MQSLVSMEAEAENNIGIEEFSKDLMKMGFRAENLTI